MQYVLNQYTTLLLASALVILGWRGAVAYLGERLNGIEEAEGSSPSSSTRLDKIKNLHVVL